MKTMNLMETNLPELYSRGLYDEKGWDLGAAQTDKMAEVFFEGVSTVLKDIKSKEYPVAFVFDEPNGEFSGAAVVRFIENEDKNMPGHWNYIWTFNKEDIPDNARQVRLKDIEFQVYFRTVAAKKFVMGFISPASMVDCGNYLIKQIKQWLADNVTEGDEVCLSQEGVFQARAGVEDGEVVMSIEVLGETKAIIKDDAGNEV